MSTSTTELCYCCGHWAEIPTMVCGLVAERDHYVVPLCANCLEVLKANVTDFVIRHGNPRPGAAGPGQ